MEYDVKKLEWLESDLLSEFDNLAHACFLRHGGVSEKPFNTLNLGSWVGDVRDQVLINREVVRRQLDLSRICYGKLIHSKTVVRITLENMDDFPEGDALITNLRDVGLAVTHADCQAAIFFDPVTESIGIVHAGWKGVAQNIYAEVVRQFEEEFGSDPTNLFVWIPPSIGPDNSEFKNFKEEWPEQYWSFQIKPTYFDLWAIAKKQLAECNIPETQIEITETCTFDNTQDYFSYRKEKKTGRNATVVGLRKKNDRR